MKQATRLAIFLCVCGVLFAQVQDQAKPNNPAPSAAMPPSPAQPQSGSSGNSPKGFVLEDATPVKLRINRTISSADAHVGDTVDFEVLEEVLVNNILVVPKGGLALATVTDAQSKRRMARGGKLDINIDYVRLIDDQKAALRAVSEVKGGGHTGAMTGGIVATSLVFFPAAPFFLFMHGKDISIPKGTEITAYVNGDMKLDLAKFQPAQPASSTPAAPNPVPAATAQAQLQVTSTPEGADIEMDGGFVGDTPSTVGVAPGQHQLSVKKAGFQPWVRKITVSSGQVNVNAVLEPTH
jgi:PEGA domain